MKLIDCAAAYRLVGIERALFKDGLAGCGIKAGLHGAFQYLALLLRLADALVVAVDVANAKLGHLRSEEHTSALQSRENRVCRLRHQKKKEKRSLLLPEHNDERP